jgi:hypothetical protein
MTDEILIGFGGLPISVLTYFAGVWRTERRHSKEDREARVRRVFAKDMEFRRHLTIAQIKERMNMLRELCFILIKTNSLL